MRRVLSPALGMEVSCLGFGCASLGSRVSPRVGRRSLDLAEFRYRNGVDSYLNVLTAQTGLYDAQQALVTMRLQRLTSLVDLYRALGGGWIERTGDQPRAADA